MATISFSNLQVGGVVESDVAVWGVRPRTGNITLAILNLTARDLIAKAKPANPLKFWVYESDNRKDWVKISGTDPIGGEDGVAPGGQGVMTVLTQKRFIKITGAGVGGGGFAKVDLSFNGLQFFGTVDVDLIGKSGFSRDGLSGPGVAEYGASPWIG